MPGLSKAANTCASRWMGSDPSRPSLDASKRTPPDASRLGQDSDKLGGGMVTAEDAMKMPDEDFLKLDEKTLARVRGDEL